MQIIITNDFKIHAIKMIESYTYFEISRHLLEKHTLKFHRELKKKIILEISRNPAIVIIKKIFHIQTFYGGI